MGRETTDEIRKLKAIIVKHENRIRGLEAALRAHEGDETDAKAASNNTESKATTESNNKENNESANNDQSHSSAPASEEV